MSIIETHVDTNSPDFQENARSFQQQLAELHERVQQVRQGGGQEL